MGSSTIGTTIFNREEKYCFYNIIILYFTTFYIKEKWKKFLRKNTKTNLQIRYNVTLKLHNKLIFQDTIIILHLIFYVQASKF